MKLESPDTLFSTPADLKNLGNNFLWRDIELTLKHQIDVQQADLETADSIEDIKFAQGVITCCRIILEFPEVLLTELTEEQENGDEPE